MTCLALTPVFCKVSIEYAASYLEYSIPHFPPHHRKVDIDFTHHIESYRMKAIKYPIPYIKSFPVYKSIRIFHFYNENKSIFPTTTALFNPFHRLLVLREMDIRFMKFATLLSSIHILNLGL